MTLLHPQVGINIKRAADIHEATIVAQIRDRLFSMKNGHDRMRVLEKYGSDPGSLPPPS
jgi:hypothetical protein